MQQAKRQPTLSLILCFAAASCAYHAALAVPPALVDAQAQPVKKAELELLHNRVRYFAVLVENFAEDNRVYPTLPRASGLEPYRLLVSVLPGSDIHRFPTSDLDGRDLLYWSDGKGYVVIAVGSDASQIWTTLQSCRFRGLTRKSFVAASPTTLRATSCS